METTSLHERHPHLVALAVKAFGDEQRALDWFYSIHPDWGLLPVYVARTHEGATRVSQALTAVLEMRKP